MKFILFNKSDLQNSEFNSKKLLAYIGEFLLIAIYRKWADQCVSLCVWCHKRSFPPSLFLSWREQEEKCFLFSTFSIVSLKTPAHRNSIRIVVDQFDHESIAKTCKDVDQFE